MKRQVPRGGRIINNGSLSAQAPRPHSAPYAATKHAACGTPFEARWYCPTCGEAVDEAETAVAEFV